MPSSAASPFSSSSSSLATASTEECDPHAREGEGACLPLHYIDRCPLVLCDPCYAMHRERVTSRLHPPGLLSRRGAPRTPYRGRLQGRALGARSSPADTMQRAVMLGRGEHDKLDYLCDSFYSNVF